jgi:hypothetical protein
MKADKMKNIAVIILLATQLFGQTKPAVELEGAIAKEQVDGDLKTAIPIYHKIAADTSAPRDIRARALLHQARCYEKLGQQAQSLYRQIVRDFGDQPEAAQARARLSALTKENRPAGSASVTPRKIEVAGSQMWPGQTDGRRVVYLDKTTGQLIYGDLAGKSKRVIFRKMPGDSFDFLPSRDFSMVAIRSQLPDKRELYSVVKTDGTGYREVAKLDGYQVCCDWSWDNRYLLTRPLQHGSNTLVRISVADGQIRQLLSPKTVNTTSSGFSPDGRFVAYQVAPSDADQESRIFVLPAEGGEPQLVYEERPTAGSSQSFRALKLLDWTADGRYLAIASERAGKGALYLVPIKDGRSTGASVFVQYGDFEFSTTTAKGAMVYSSAKPGGWWAVYLAFLDSDSRPSDWKHLDLHLGNVSRPFLRLSGDSNQIVYVGRHEDTGWNAGPNSGQVVHLYKLSSGEDREVYHALGDSACTWAAQQPKLFCVDYTSEKTDIFSIAVDSGEIARLHTIPTPQALRIGHPTRDDRGLYMYRSTSGGWELLRWEIATGQEMILERDTSPAKVSPDERWPSRWAKQNLQIRPVSGGDWKVVVSLKFQSSNHFNFTPDGNWLVYHNVDSTGNTACFASRPLGVRLSVWVIFQQQTVRAALRSARTGERSTSPLSNGYMPTNFGRSKTSSLLRRSGEMKTVRPLVTRGFATAKRRIVTVEEIDRNAV